MADQANPNQPKVVKTDEDWRKQLSDEEYRILRKAGTELPFSGKYNLFFEEGNYHCKACGELLFESDSKFNSHCGWPSFDKAVSKAAVIERPDYSHNMIRTEILCGSCHSHLGHVFPDGPTSTGIRYCVNSVSIDFKGD